MGKLLQVISPGRTEIAGNHTDHEGGHVIAGALDRYARGSFVPNDSGVLEVDSPGHDCIRIAIGEGFEPRESEVNRSPSLVRGLAAGFAARGFEPRGFSAKVVNEVATGSGLSSSAAFEVLLASAMNELWAEGALTPAELALMSQTAERDWYGKPCGLMDQAAVALGGIQHMSFAGSGIDAERIDFDFAEAGYEICLLAVGAGHADLTHEYAAVPHEMQAVARLLGAERLGELDEAALIFDLPRVRRELGDRAALRALHYFREDRLVEERAEALKAHDMASFLELTRLSGASSAMYLQNVSVPGREQSAMVALALAEELLQGEGAARIHGGGFGGTIQVFVPIERAEAFVSGADAVFGSGAAQLFTVVHEGAQFSWQ